MSAPQEGYETNPVEQADNALRVVRNIAEHIAQLVGFAESDDHGSPSYHENIEGIAKNHRAMEIWIDRIKDVDKAASILSVEPDDREAFGEL